MSTATKYLLRQKKIEKIHCNKINNWCNNWLKKCNSPEKYLQQTYWEEGMRATATTELRGGSSGTVSQPTTSPHRGPPLTTGLPTHPCRIRRAPSQWETYAWGTRSSCGGELWDRRSALELGMSGYKQEQCSLLVVVEASSIGWMGMGRDRERAQRGGTSGWRYWGDVAQWIRVSDFFFLQSNVRVQAILKNIITKTRFC